MGACAKLYTDLGNTTMKEYRPRTFLTAEWRQLVMVNFAVDPAVLEPFVPAGTSLDSWKGATLVSLVGFRFLNTRVLGIPIPGHKDFEEVNLRFYVTRDHPDGVRRGVVFIKELVPRRAVLTRTSASSAFGMRWTV